MEKYILLNETTQTVLFFLALVVLFVSRVKNAKRIGEKYKDQ